MRIINLTISRNKYSIICIKTYFLKKMTCKGEIYEKEKIIRRTKDRMSGRQAV